MYLNIMIWYELKFIPYHFFLKRRCLHMQKIKNRFLSCIMIFLITFSFLIIGCNSNSVYAKNVSNTTEPLNNINYRIDAKNENLQSRKAQ